MSEHSEQCVVIEWARHSGLRWLFAIPNGAKLPYTRGANGRRYSPQAIKLLSEGLLPGVSDLFLPVVMGKYHGLFIELKDGKNKTTPEQNAFLLAMNEAGYRAVVCRGADEGIAAIREYMGWWNE